MGPVPAGRQRPPGAGVLTPRQLHRKPLTMKSPRTTAASIGDYLAALPPATRRVVRTVLDTIRKPPGAEERISYQIPSFKLGGQYPGLRRGLRAAHRRLPGADR